MSEVSCRAFSYFVEAERAGLCSIDQLVAGLPVDRTTFDDPDARVPWEVWAELCDRFAQGFDGDRALSDTARFALNEVFAGYLQRVLGQWASPRLFYELLIRWGVPGLYRQVRASVDTSHADRLIIEVSLLPGYRPCRSWFVMFAGGMAVAPGFVGLPASRVDVLEVSPSHGRYAVHARKGMVAEVVGRLRATVRGSTQLADELIAQRDELSEAWQQVRARTHALANVLEALPIPLVVHRKRRIIYANPALAERVGGHEEALRGRPLESLFVADDRVALNALITQETPIATLQLRRDDGSEVMLEGRAVAGSAFDGAPADILFGRDITDQLRAHRNVARSEATVRALFQALPELVVRVNREFRVLDIKPSREFPESELMQRFVGQKSEALLEALPHLAVPEVTAAREALMETLAAGELYEQVVHVPDRKGNIRALRLRGIPILDGTEALLLIRDETEQRRVELRLAVAERMASVGTLAAGVAHEINNPLTYVNMSLELLQEALHGAKLNRTELSRLASDVHEGAQRIRETVNRMRELSHGEVRAPSSVAPEEVVRSALAMAAHETRHRARVEPDLQTVPNVIIDRTALGQVVLNLIVNAAHAIDRAGPRTLGHVLSVRLYPADDHVILEVTDTGEGIPDSLVPRIFDPFFTTKDRSTGTGLGLSIVQGIVADAGGEIGVESHPGQGTTFRVSLPAGATEDKAPAPQPEARTPSSQGSAQRRQVVILDDEPAVGRVLSQALRAHDVELFTSPQDGLQRILDGPDPDVVLCDLMMPGLTGMEIHQQIAQGRPHLLPRLIFMTGGTFTEQAEDFVSRDDVRVIHKPPSIRALRAAVEA